MNLAILRRDGLAIGEPPRLGEAEMAQVIEQIRRMSYGQAPDLDAVADTPQSRAGSASAKARPAPAARAARKAAGR